jgi:DNA-binding MarR family transcriptional regulator
MADDRLSLYFRFFNEIGIIEQLSRAMLEARLPQGFVAAQFNVLNHLIRLGDGRTPLAIARAFQVPKTSMTHSLAILQGAGLIEFRANPKDARSKLVFITPQGRAFRDATIGRLAPDIMRLSTAIPPDMIERLLPELETVRKFLDTDRDGQG